MNNYNIFPRKSDVDEAMSPLQNAITSANDGYNWAPITPDMVEERIVSLPEEPRDLAIELVRWCNSTQKDVMEIATEDGGVRILSGGEEQNSDYAYNRSAHTLTTAQRINGIVFGQIFKNPADVGLRIEIAEKTGM